MSVRLAEGKHIHITSDPDQSYILKLMIGYQALDCLRSLFPVQGVLWSDVPNLRPHHVLPSVAGSSFLPHQSRFHQSRSKSLISVTINQMMSKHTSRTSSVSLMPAHQSSICMDRTTSSAEQAMQILAHSLKHRACRISPAAVAAGHCPCKFVPAGQRHPMACIKLVISISLLAGQHLPLLRQP